MNKLVQVLFDSNGVPQGVWAEIKWPIVITESERGGSKVDKKVKRVKLRYPRANEMPRTQDDAIINYIWNLVEKIETTSGDLEKSDFTIVKDTLSVGDANTIVEAFTELMAEGESFRKGTPRGSQEVLS